jgi:hypothetical protein
MRRRDIFQILQDEDFVGVAWARASSSFTRVTLDSTKPLHRLQLYILACALYEQQVNIDSNLDLKETGKKVPIRRVLNLLGILVAKKTGKPGVMQLLFPPILRKHFSQGFQFSGLPLLRLLLSHSAPGLVNQGTLLEYGIHEKFLVRLGALIPVVMQVSEAPLLGKAVLLLAETNVANVRARLQKTPLSPIPGVASRKDNTMSIAEKAKKEGRTEREIVNTIWQQPMHHKLHHSYINRIFVDGILKEDTIGVPGQKSALPDLIAQFNGTDVKGMKQIWTLLMFAAKNLYTSSLSKPVLKDEIGKAEAFLKGCLDKWDRALLLVMATTMNKDVTPLTGELLPFAGKKNRKGAIWNEAYGESFTEGSFCVKVCSEKEIKKFFGSDYDCMAQYSRGRLAHGTPASSPTSTSSCYLGESRLPGQLQVVSFL